MQTIRPLSPIQLLDRCKSKFSQGMASAAAAAASSISLTNCTDADKGHIHMLAGADLEIRRRRGAPSSIHLLSLAYPSKLP